MHMWKYKDGYYVFDVRVLLEDDSSYDEVLENCKELMREYPLIKQYCFNIEDEFYRKEVM